MFLTKFVFKNGLLFSRICTFLQLVSLNSEAQEFSFLSAHPGNPLSLSVDHMHMMGVQNPNNLGSALDEEKGALSVPLYTETSTSIFFTAKGQRTGLFERIFIPDRNFEIPPEFGSADVGLGWIQKSSGEGSYGGSASIGSTGKSLLSSENNRTIGANAFLETKTGEGNSWYFILSYSNNRTFFNNMPLPLVAYGINGDNYRLLLGLPFVFFNWRPMPLSISAMVSIFSAFSDVGLFVWGPFQIYSGISWTPRAYQNLVPDYKDERLFYEKREWTSGLRMFLGRDMNFSLGYVYGFERKFYLGKSTYDTTSSKVGLMDSWGLIAGLKMSF